MNAKKPNGKKLNSFFDQAYLGKKSGCLMVRDSSKY